MRRTASAPEPLWIFGYGSLVWRPEIPFDLRRPALLRGWVRRFWQGSTDHRGVPGAPGRVVTLIEAEAGETAGVAFRVPAEERDVVLARLDHREQGGYERRVQRAEPLDGGSPLRVLVYVATPRNPNYLGPATVEEIVAQVRASAGPSGPNQEYVLRLDAALRELGRPDPHVAEIATLLSRPTARPS